MSERPSFDDILIRQKTEKTRLEAEQHKQQEERKRQKEPQAVFAHVRDCRRDQFPEGEAGDWLFYEEFARRLATLAHYLEQRGLLCGLIERLQNTGCAVQKQERDARNVICYILLAASSDNLQEAVRRLRETDGLPFAWQVNDWLRHHLEWEVLDLERVAAGQGALADTINGVTWPVLKPDEPDPLQVLDQACDIADSALGIKERSPLAGGVSPAQVVEGLWSVVRAVAEQTFRQPPVLPEQIPGVREARQVVESVRSWGSQSNPEPGLTAAAPPTVDDSFFPQQTLDPDRCPGCGAVVPQSCRILNEYICRECGDWRLHTGVLVMPVAGPQGTPPAGMTSVNTSTVSC
jgi:hypothetical protein